MGLAIIIPIIVFTALLTVATIVGSVLFLAGRPGSGVRRVGGSLATVCGSLLCIGVILGTGVATVIRPDFVQSPSKPPHKAGHPLPPHLKSRAEQPDAKTVAMEEPQIPADALIPPTDDRSVSSDPAKQPEWTKAAEVRHGDIVLHVVTSQQFATIEEARANAAVKAREILLADFERIYRTSAQRLDDDALKLAAVKNEYVETVERDFGNFFAPMHRVWWQVEVSPQVRSELYPVWRNREQRIRAAGVAGTLLLITVGLALVSWLSRKKPVAVMPQPLGTATNPVVVGLGAATLLAKRCRGWWR